MKKTKSTITLHLDRSGDMYIQKIPNESGAYPAPQSNYAEGLLVISEEFLEVFFQYNGFVSIEHDGTQVTDISPKTEAWEKWRARSPGARRSAQWQRLC